jgi:polysaccharide export outer membrane protein
MNAPNRAASRFIRDLLVLATLIGATVVRAQDAAAAAGDENKAIVYKISRTDKISIVVVGEADLNVVGKRVDANGNVNLALVGEVKIAGLSVSQAQTMIENAYRDGRILRNPQVTINIEEYAPRTVSVSGMVKQPGTINLPPESTMTLKDLILKAGGFTETANGSKVRVTRVLPDGTTRIFTLNIDSILKGRDTGKSSDSTFVLEPDDIVYVPESII